jgi:hypothetical protein
MGSAPSKLRCLYLPAQSGKTRKAEELITEVKAAEKITEEGSIDIWISANNKLLVSQTTSRLKKDLGTAANSSCSAASTASTASESESDSDSDSTVIRGEIVSWTSGTKKPCTAEELAYECLNDETEMVLVCAHKGRLDHVAKLIHKINGFKRFSKKINIWIDEADYSIKLWLKHASLVDLKSVNTITLVSATFGEVFKRFPEGLRVIPYLNTHPEVYRRLLDCKCIEEGDGREEASGYVEAVLDKYPSLVTPGLKAFIPGNVTKASHEDLSELLLARGFAVLILNGEFKEIRLPNGESTIDLFEYLTVKDPKAAPPEFASTLVDLYAKHRLNRFPLAITGYMCVERGITFQSSEFLFDYAIVSPIRDKAEAYQAMARVFGNVGGFAGYRPATIYSDTKTFNRVRDQEESAVHVARIVHEEGLELVDETILKRAALWSEEQIWKLEMNFFDSFEEAKEFIKKHGGGTPRRPTLEEDGFYHSSTTKKKALLALPEVLEEMRGWSKTSLFDVGKDSDRAFHSRLVIAYRDTEDPDTAVFLVRSIKKRRMILVRKKTA